MCRENEWFVAIEPVSFQEDIAWVVGQRMSDPEIYRRGAVISSRKPIALDGTFEISTAGGSETSE